MSLRIYQVEPTNQCNASCRYCPHDKMTRSKGYISPEIVYKIAQYCQSIGQDYIALHHMGEPLLHPRLSDIIKIFNDHDIRSEFSTNGVLLLDFGQSILESKPALIRIACDYFYNKKNYINNINKFLTMSQDYPDTQVRIHSIVNKNLNVFKSFNNVIYERKILDNWASQIKSESNLLTSNSCYFLDYNYVVILWDGSISTCCMDYNGMYLLGTIDNINDINYNTKTSLCNGCKKMQFAEGGAWSK